MKYIEFQMEEEEEESGLRWGGDGDIRTMQRHRSRARTAPARTLPRAKRRSPLDHIRAQSRCVVHPDLPLSAYSETIPWEALLRVVTAPIDCPICISTSSVPRMLECGHVMCLPCFFRFLKHTQDHFCPVCGEHVSNSLLPVSFLAADPLFMPREGDELALRLMRKSQHISLPTESEHTKPKPDMLLYSRVVCATLPYLRQEYVQERDTLEAEQKEALELYGDDEGYPEALDSVRKKLQAKLERLKCEATGEPDEPSEDGVGSTASPSAYYYQTAFESPVTFVLSPLDVSVLKSAFGTFDQFPSTILTKVENIIYTSFEQDPSQRKWMRYLSHLSDTAPLGVLECDWRGIIAPEHLKKYHKALSQRRQKTFAKRNKEEESRIRAQTEMDELFRLSARDEPLPLEQLEIDKNSLPTLGNSAPKVAKAKTWNKNLADLQEAQQLLGAAKQVKKKGKSRLVIQ